MTTRATLHQGRILLQCPYSDANYKRCKSIPGGRWKTEHRAWSYPVAWDVWQSIKRAFPTVEVLAPLADWIENGKAEVKKQTKRSLATDAKLKVIPDTHPVLAEMLRADQRVGARWVAEAYRGAGLVADEPGVGKTMETIAGVLEAGVTGRILVACPRLSVRPVWRYELARFGETVYIARGTRAQRDRALQAFESDPAERKWLVIVAEMLRVKEEPSPKDPKKKVFAGFEFPQLFAREWSTVIVDESHKMFGSLTVVKGNLVGKGLKRLPTCPDPTLPRRLALSGTPFGKGGRIQGMFGTLHWLWPDEFTSFWKWADRHFEIEERQVSRFQKAKKIVGLRDGVTEADFLANLGPRILRRTKADVLPFLPPKLHVNVMCEMSPRQASQYQQMELDGEIVTDDGVLSADGVLAAITRAKQLANGSIAYDGENVTFEGTESCKMDMLFQAMEQRGILDDDGELKIIVGSQFNEWLYELADRLKAQDVPFHLLTGASSDKKRDRMMEDFQSDGGARVFLMNIKAGGVSVTLDAADEVHAIDEMWDPGENTQFEDRAHRASRMHQVTIFHYVTEGTIDQTIMEDVEGKRFQQFKVLDGRRGLKYLRKMTEYRKPKPDNQEAA